jgi:hypothetical protein
MALETTTGIRAFDMCRVVLEVEKGPELEAGVGDREINPIVSGLLPRVVEMGVLIHVKDAPDLVIGQELIPPALRVALGLPLLRRRSFHKESWGRHLDHRSRWRPRDCARQSTGS